MLDINLLVPAAVVLPELALPEVTVAAGRCCRACGFSVRLRAAEQRMQLTVPGGGELP